jgi:hypothetical protein
LFHGIPFRDDISGFMHALTLAREDGLINTERTRGDRKQSAVGWNLVTNRYIDDITRDKV